MKPLICYLLLDRDLLFFNERLSEKVFLSGCCSVVPHTYRLYCIFCVFFAGECILMIKNLDNLICSTHCLEQYFYNSLGLPILWTVCICNYGRDRKNKLISAGIWRKYSSGSLETLLLPGVDGKRDHGHEFPGSTT